MVYMNLAVELLMSNVTAERAAKWIGLSPDEFRQKLYGIESFTVEEIRVLKEIFIPGVSLDHLCQTCFLSDPTERETKSCDKRQE